jgi:hypothetical protein
MGFIRMECQSIRIHPGSHTGQRRFRFLSTATQHDGVIGVSHHHPSGFPHFYVKLVKIDIGKQGANDRPLGTTRRRSPTRHVFHDVLLGRGRNADRSAPPAQIRAGAANASGSTREYLASKRRWG